MAMSVRVGFHVRAASRTRAAWETSRKAASWRAADGLVRRVATALQPAATSSSSAAARYRLLKLLRY